MPAHTPPHPDAALSLALAMVASSTAPLVLLDGDLKVIGLSASFCRAFDADADSAAGRSFFALGAGEWDAPQLRSLLNVTASGAAEIDSYEMDFKSQGRGARDLVLYARKLDYGDAASVRLLLTVADITEARLAEKLKDDLLREKEILLQEVQHRVANSLQIIASVILQNARRVESEETRSHLHDAHHRVMSVAVLQQQLAASRLGDVELRAYFDSLCQSIGASMIRDHNQISLDVSVDESAVHADVSVSLGLIVTELVINALKHAFPAAREGKIVVGYESHGPNWSLSVRDDGVGMPAQPGIAKAGLGTSIVEALARQLSARVQVVDLKPGVKVSVIHSQLAAVETDAERAEPAV
jgi:two-component system, sensor histidine kinase PdtaS